MMRSVQEGQRSSFHDGNFLHLRPRLTREASSRSPAMRARVRA